MLPDALRLVAVWPVDDDVLRVAKAYLKPSNRTVGLYIPVDQLPERAEVPPAPRITMTLMSGRV